MTDFVELPSGYWDDVRRNDAVIFERARKTHRRWTRLVLAQATWSNPSATQHTQQELSYLGVRRPASIWKEQWRSLQMFSEETGQGIFTAIRYFADLRIANERLDVTRVSIPIGELSEYTEDDAPTILDDVEVRELHSGLAVANSDDHEIFLSHLISGAENG